MPESPIPILIVEGHPMLMEALCVVIAHAGGYRDVLGISSALDAIALAAVRQPGLILFSLERDLQEDALTLSVLRRAAPEALILALTNDEIPGQGQAALEHGADTVLDKSARSDALLETIQHLLSQPRGLQLVPGNEETPKNDTPGDLSPLQFAPI